MKTLITITMCLLAINLNAQEIELDYIPSQKENVTDKDYEIAKMQLKRTYEEVKDNDNKFNCGSYWNIASAYSKMKEDPTKIKEALLLSQKENPEQFCVVINMTIEIYNNDVTQTKYYKLLGNDFKKMADDCKGINIASLSLEESLAKKEMQNLEGLDEPLIEQLIILMDKDQRHRGGSFADLKKNEEEQNLLDREVESTISQIFDTQGYPGKDVVGKHYQNYACLFLEHTGRLETMEKYFPLVINAYKNNQLDKVPVTMLLDRMYSFKYGTQIFGSQGGVPYADLKTLEEVKKKYGL